MIAATATVEIVSTTTETEALLLEANLIKQLRPRFNVQLRDDKSFPYILITGDHWAPQILKHRGAQSRPGAISVRSPRPARSAAPSRRCNAPFWCAPAPTRSSKAAPGPACCIRFGAVRARAPARSISPAIPSWFTKRRISCPAAAASVKQQLAGEMEKASAELEFEPAALYRDRLAACRAIQSQQGINPRSVEEADVFAIHQEGGYSCIEVFFFRTGQNWGNRAYFPPRREVLHPGRSAGRVPRPVLRRPAAAEARAAVARRSRNSELLADALSIKAGYKVEVTTPQRGEKKEMIAHALTNAREALGRKLADTATQSRLLQGLVDHIRACRIRRSGSRSTTTATSRAPTRSAP